jgi:hypothetical protein
VEQIARAIRRTSSKASTQKSGIPSDANRELEDGGQAPSRSLDGVLTIPQLLALDGDPPSDRDAGKPTLQWQRPILPPRARSYSFFIQTSDVLRCLVDSRPPSRFSIRQNVDSRERPLLTRVPGASSLVAVTKATSLVPFLHNHPRLDENVGPPEETV